MKRVKLISVVVCLLAMLFVASSVHADLDLLGQGTSTYGTYNLIYDTDLDITWFDYTTSSSDTWQNQLDWADALSVTFGSNTYTEWRLPTTVDGIFAFGFDGSSIGGYHITTSEMGHLFYTELGNEASYDTFGNETGCGLSGQPSCLTNTGDFQDLQSSYYWSTEYTANLGLAWNFGTSLGNQGRNNIGNYDYAIAVMSGRAVVPEPISSILFLTGGGMLVGRRYLKKRVMS